MRVGDKKETKNHYNMETLLETIKMYLHRASQTCIQK